MTNTDADNIPDADRSIFDVENITNTLDNDVKNTEPSNFPDIKGNRIKAAQVLLDTWEHITYLSSYSIIVLTLLQGFNYGGFKLNDSTFITTIVSLVTGVIILGTITKLLNND